MVLELEQAVSKQIEVAKKYAIARSTICKAWNKRNTIKKAYFKSSRKGKTAKIVYNRQTDSLLDSLMYN